jgi:hypothetical protein
VLEGRARGEGEGVTLGSTSAGGFFPAQRRDIPAARGRVERVRALILVGFMGLAGGVCCGGRGLVVGCPCCGKRWPA